MDNLLFVTLILLGFHSPTPVMAAEIVGSHEIVYTQENAEVIISAYAVHYGIPAKPLIDTLRCESKFRRDAIGDFGTSFGVAQIHLPAHTDITKAQALDPFFSIDFAAHQFSLGNQKIWSCYNLLYGTPKGGGDS